MTRRQIAKAQIALSRIESLKAELEPIRILELFKRSLETDIRLVVRIGFKQADNWNSTKVAYSPVKKENRLITSDVTEMIQELINAYNNAYQIKLSELEGELSEI